MIFFFFQREFDVKKKDAENDIIIPNQERDAEAYLIYRIVKVLRERRKKIDATKKTENNSGLLSESKRIFGSLSSLDLENMLASHGAASDYNERLRQNAIAMGHTK